MGYQTRLLPLTVVPQSTLRARCPFQVHIRLISLLHLNWNWNAPMRVSFVTLFSGLAALTLINALPLPNVPDKGVDVPLAASLPTLDGRTVHLPRAPEDDPSRTPSPILTLMIASQ